MKNCIINLATGRYYQIQQRLIASLKNNFDGAVFAFVNEAQIDAPIHRDNPYAFKIFAFYYAISKGYENILWCDSSLYAIRPVKELFDIIEMQGYFFERSGHNAGEWTNDNALKYFNLTREEAMSISLFHAGFCGLSVQNKTAMDFLSEWKQAMQAGAFKGLWSNNYFTESQSPLCRGHRHDMACGAIIAHRLNMNLVPGITYLDYAAPEKQVKNSIVFKAQGC